MLNEIKKFKRKFEKLDYQLKGKQEITKEKHFEEILGNEEDFQNIVLIKFWQKRKIH